MQIEITRTGQQALDLEIIQRSLQDFGRFVEAFPPEDQKDLMQLLIGEVAVQPSTRTTKKPPPGGRFHNANPN